MLNDIAQDRELGVTLDDRMEALKRAKSWNFTLSTIAVLAALGTCVQRSPSRPPAILILALIPAVALYLLNRKPHLYALGKPKGDPRAELALTLFAPAFGFFASGVEPDLVSARPLLPMMVAVALVFIVGFYAFGRKGPQTAAFYAMVPLCAGFCSFGGVVTFDTIMDRGAAAFYPAQVLSKHSERDLGTTYYLDLGAWGPFDGRNQVSVPYGVYETAEPGTAVCLEVNPGALHGPWYERVGCEVMHELQVPPG